MAAAKDGLHSTDWHSHLPCLVCLATLMQLWSDEKPLPLPQDKLILDYTELDATVLENMVAQFYTDSFFIFFGCAAVIPTHLP